MKITMADIYVDYFEPTSYSKIELIMSGRAFELGGMSKVDNATHSMDIKWNAVRDGISDEVDFLEQYRAS